MDNINLTLQISDVEQFVLAASLPVLLFDVFLRDVGILRPVWGILTLRYSITRGYFTDAENSLLVYIHLAQSMTINVELD